MKKYESLHCHTKVSDGLMTHEEILHACEELNMGTVAFTDHDSLPDKKVVKKLRSYSGSVDWIIGIEMSSGMPVELEKYGGDFHITGLFVNPLDSKLLEHCKKAQKARIERMELIVKNLRSLGFSISADDCLKESRGEAVGRPHIVSALKGKVVNLKIIEKLRRKMEIESKKDVEVRKRYIQMMEGGEEQYPYILFLGDDAYIKGIYIHYLYKKPFDESVSLVRDGGGLAFFAHWFTDNKKFTPDLVEKFLRENRIDGMEVVYGLTTVGEGITKEELISQFEYLENVVDKYGKLKSGGIDVHNIENLQLLSDTNWYAERTVGLAKEIITRSGVDTEWSSFLKKG